MKRTATTLAAAAAALALALPAAGQETVQPAGASIVLNVSAEPTVGVYTFLSPTLQLGVELGASLAEVSDAETESSQEEWSVRVAPALKLFTAAEGSFRPYVFLSPFFELGQASEEVELFDETVEIAVDTRTVGGELGFGVDWFPASRISIGGHVGFGGGLTNVEADDDFEGEAIDIDGTFLSTFTSGVRVHLYF